MSFNYTGTDGGFQFGHRFINNISGSTSTASHIGTLIRMDDDTTEANTIRGLEVQAWSGTNVLGVNTGIATFGKTFGLHAVTDGLAGGKSQPAAVFADLQNATQGNAIRAYTSTATSADIALIFHTGTAYTGDALSIDIASGSGTFTTGNFWKARLSGTTKAHLDSDGNMFVNLNSSGNSALCHTTSGAEEEIVDCATDPQADYMEMYPTMLGSEEGDILVTSFEDFAISSAGDKVAKLVKSSTSYDQNIIGIVSSASRAGDFNSIGYNIKQADNPQPIALSGRVKVKVNLDNGPIAVGDRITTSTVSGVGMKATQSGMVVGIALESLDTVASHSASSGQAGSYGKVMVFVNSGYWVPTTTALAGGTASQSIEFVYGGMPMADLFNVIVAKFADLFEIVFEKGIIRVAELISDRLTSKELCLEDICITRDQLEALLNASGVPQQTSSEEEQATPTLPNPSPTPDVGDTDSSILDLSAESDGSDSGQIGTTPEPSPSVTPTPDPSPSPTPDPTLPNPSPTPDVGDTDSSILDLSAESDGSDSGQIGTIPTPEPTPEPSE